MKFLIVKRAWPWVRKMAIRHQKFWPAVLIILGALSIYTLSKVRERKDSIYYVDRSGDFENGRILDSSIRSINTGKEKFLSKKASEILQSQRTLEGQIGGLEEKIFRLEEHLKGSKESTLTSTIPATSPNEQNTVRFHTQDQTFNSKQFTSMPDRSRRRRVRSYKKRRASRKTKRVGPSMISFPVHTEKKTKELTVPLPIGSYVKGKLLTGLEARERVPYPVLVQLDFAYILPNHHRLDLSGCFMIVKAIGNLSIERVEMQATKLSCVSQSGKMFEREINGFIVDDKDNSFAVIGSVNSKQQRVAAMAFLSSVVEGVGQAIQSTQQTQQVTPLGGSQSVLTGSEMKSIAGGGASHAATMVAQWYLKQAQNLSPTINVGSGRDIWIVMQESVDLPNDYFHKNGKGEIREGVYAYFTRLLN